MTPKALKVNSTSPRDQQLAGIPHIYDPENEALDVLAIELVEQPGERHSDGRWR
ncbi:hypothetical protein AB0395_33910 [Streptosporangium sp. NPDC051023]|uniref:hypothetical protein n=1 Tax=Streptosporangium sp. NPDC051023 TaxID=3155410 RepID=UPI00344C330B